MPNHDRTPGQQRQVAATQDEMTLLGAMLQDDDLAAEAATLLKAEHLEYPPHVTLFRLLAIRIAAGVSCDVLEVSTALMAEGGAAKVGGAVYLAELPEHAPGIRVALTGTPEHPGLTDRIKARATRRRLLEIGEAVKAVGLGNRGRVGRDYLPNDPTACAAEVAGLLSHLGTPDERTEFTIGENIDRAMARREAERTSGRPRAIQTGLPNLDNLLDGGLRPGDLVIVAGRPGMGKTSVALAMSSHAAEGPRDGPGRHVGFISLEMDGEDLSDRILARVVPYPFVRIRSGEFDLHPEAEEWREHVRRWPIRTSCVPGITPAGIAAQARQWASRGLDMLVIDYLQRVRHGSADRHDIAVGRTSTLCKELAMELKIPVVLLSQLNRDVERRQTPKKKGEEREWWEWCALPRASDLKDSGDIEQDADVIMFPVRGCELDTGISEEEAVIVVEKNRNGRTGVARVMWDGPTASYRELGYVKDDGGDLL